MGCRAAGKRSAPSNSGVGAVGLSAGRRAGADREETVYVVLDGELSGHRRRRRNRVGRLGSAPRQGELRSIHSRTDRQALLVTVAFAPGAEVA